MYQAVKREEIPICAREETPGAERGDGYQAVFRISSRLNLQNETDHANVYNRAEEHARCWVQLGRPATTAQPPATKVRRTTLNGSRYQPASQSFLGLLHLQTISFLQCHFCKGNYDVCKSGGRAVAIALRAEETARPDLVKLVTTAREGNSSS
jgi:hypothetical protein